MTDAPTTTLPDDVPVAPARSGSDRSDIRAMLVALNPVDRGAASIAVLLAVLFAPPLLFEGWTPRMAVILTLLPSGLWTLGLLCARRDRAALALGTALVTCAVSCAVSGAVRITVLGAVGRDLSLLMLAGTAAAWAIGRSVTPTGRDAVTVAVVGGLCASAFVGVLQVLFDIEGGSLALFAGRPTGFTSNPVYFGALSAGGFVCAVASRRWRGVGAAAILLLGIATAWSDSRVALAAALVAVVALVVVHRDRIAVVRSTFGAAVLAVGLVTDRLVGAGSDSVERLLTESGDGRSDVWRYAFHAWRSRPLFGYGPGRFRAAVQGRFSPSFVRDHATDELVQPWFDAHNVVINLLVSVGLVATLLIAAWVVVWSRSARGPLVWLVAVVSMSWMLQPVSVSTLPLVALLFGAAGVATRSTAAPAVDIAADVRAPEDDEAADVHRSALPGRRAATVMTLIGVAFGAWVLIADVRLSAATDSYDADAAASAASMYLGDPIVADIVAQVYGIESVEGAVVPGEIDWHRRAVDAEPDRPYFWMLLAASQLHDGRLGEAANSIDRSLALQPYNMRTLPVAGQIAIEMRDEARLAIVLDRMCAVELADCDLSPAEVLRRVDAQQSAVSAGDGDGDG